MQDLLGGQGTGASWVAQLTEYLRKASILQRGRVGMGMQLGVVLVSNPYRSC